MRREDFIKKYTPHVVDSTQGTGLFPSVKMAQAIIESADRSGRAGQSELARVYNNFFGIKVPGADDWKGKAVNMKTREVFDGQDKIITDAFRVYPAPNESFHDHTRFLTENPRYRANGVFSASTPEEQAQALQRAGYATDPNYANTIIRLIQMHDLKALDKKNDDSLG